MGLFAIIGKEFEESDSEFLFCVCAGSLIGTWACNRFLYPDVWGVSLVCFSYMSMFIAVVLCVFTGRIVQSTFVILFCSYVSITSGTRRALPILVCAILYSLISALCVPYRATFKVLLAGLAGVGLVAALAYIGVNEGERLAEVFNLTEYQYHHTIGRAAQLFTSDELDSSDQKRLEAIDKTLTLAKSNFAPKGFFAKYSEVSTVGGYADFPIFEFVYTLGSALALVFFAVFFVQVSRNLYSVHQFRPESTDRAVMGCAFAICILWLTNGGFMYFPTETPLTGFIFGRLLRRPLKQSNSGLSKLSTPSRRSIPRNGLQNLRDVRTS